MRLGHCICDPRLSCPCDILRTKDVCPCAGERLGPAAGPVRLTRLVEKPGCASKIDQAMLQRILGPLDIPADPRVIVGAPAGDDAGVFRADDGPAWVQTVDVFAPCVDDPYLFGQIAAANSVSDIYAMGGSPLTALSIIAFPARELPESICSDILRGGVDKMGEAGVAVIGGHSIDDHQIKAGFAVTGRIDCDKIITNAAARPGDALVLTKPIGTGILSFAAQIDRVPPGAAEAAGLSMATLNRTAAELLLPFAAHACTDVTGFGLIGHLSSMAAASGVDVEVVWDDVPLLDGVLDCVGAGIVPGGVERNRESSQEAVQAGADVTAAMLDILFDAQTSGGLLIALPADRAGPLLDRLDRQGITAAAIIGRVPAAGRGRVHVRTTGRRRFPQTEPAPLHEPPPPQQESTMDECCSDHGSPGEGTYRPSESVEAQKRFGEFLRAVNQPGALDAYTKQAISIALSVLARCEPCLRSHIAKARQKGFTTGEIDEAAWMAVSFGGAPLMMFYNAIRKELLQNG